MTVLIILFVERPLSIEKSYDYEQIYSSYNWRVDSRLCCLINHQFKSNQKIKIFKITKIICLKLFYFLRDNEKHWIVRGNLFSNPLFKCAYCKLQLIQNDLSLPMSATVESFPQYSKVQFQTQRFSLKWNNNIIITSFLVPELTHAQNAQMDTCD